MERETFINQMTARGYELYYPPLPPLPSRNNNITATKGDITLRFVPRADYIIYIDTPTVTAIILKDATDAETLRMIDGLTA